MTNLRFSVAMVTLVLTAVVTDTNAQRPRWALHSYALNNGIAQTVIADMENSRLWKDGNYHSSTWSSHNLLPSGADTFSTLNSAQQVHLILFGLCPLNSSVLDFPDLPPFGNGQDTRP